MSHEIDFILAGIIFVQDSSAGIAIERAGIASRSISMSVAILGRCGRLAVAAIHRAVRVLLYDGFGKLVIKNPTAK